MYLGALPLMVDNEIDTYKYAVPEHPVGNAWPAVKVETYLSEMRTSLVGPYWADVDIRDTIKQMTETEVTIRICAVVADDGKGTIVAFDPPKKNFFLRQSEMDP
jgi:hypothetical protein